MTEAEQFLEEQRKNAFPGKGLVEVTFKTDLYTRTHDAHSVTIGRKFSDSSIIELQIIYRVKGKIN